MATTSSEYALAVLGSLDDSDIDWALLHGAERLRSETISDIDVAMALPTRQLVRTFFECLEANRLRPIVVWPYDVNAASVFIVSPDLVDGVQLDLLVDPAGRGKYGLRTDFALADATSTSTVRQISELDSWLYQVRKRSAKNDQARLRALLNDRPTAYLEIAARTRRLFAGGHAEVMLSLLDGRPPRPVGSQGRNELSRRASRIRHPAGLWVHAEDEQLSNWLELAEQRLNRIIPFVTRRTISRLNIPGRLPIPGACPGTRWRAGVVLSQGAQPWKGPIVVDGTASIELAFDTITAVAVRRAQNHFGRWLSNTKR